MGPPQRWKHVDACGWLKGWVFWENHMRPRAPAVCWFPVKTTWGPVARHDQVYRMNRNHLFPPRNRVLILYKGSFQRPNLSTSYKLYFPNKKSKSPSKLRSQAAWKRRVGRAGRRSKADRSCRRWNACPALKSHGKAKGSSQNTLVF